MTRRLERCRTTAPLGDPSEYASDRVASAVSVPSDPPQASAAVIDPQPADADAEAFGALLAKVEVERGFRCRNYKERCVRRRVAVRMRATGTHTFADYARVLDADAAEYDSLLDALTINVTKFFRDRDAWDVLARLVIPTLWDETAAGGPIRVWSAGTASGEEAYSLAALFHRHAASRGESAAGRVEVLGTDVDRASLDAAALGAYPASAFGDTPADLRGDYFTPTSPARVHDDLRALVRFARHDLLREAPPAGPWHLVACRNVVIYFDRDSQEALFARVHAALAPGGVLFLGKVETLLGPARALYRPVDHPHRLFRRA